MGFPSNETGLSFAGLVKWILIITGAVFLVKAFQGLILREGATGGGRQVGDYLQGADAVRWGLQCLGFAALSFALAWAAWYFWQQNED